MTCTYYYLYILRFSPSWFLLPEVSLTAEHPLRRAEISDFATNTIGTFSFEDNSSESSESYKTANSETSPRTMGSEPMRTQDLDDRLETLETGFAELRAQNATIMQQLSQLLVKFENNTNSVTTAAPNSKSPDDKLKPSPPTVLPVSLVDYITARTGNAQCTYPQVLLGVKLTKCQVLLGL